MVSELCRQDERHRYLMLTSCDASLSKVTVQNYSPYFMKYDKYLYSANF